MLLGKNEIGYSKEKCFYSKRMILTCVLAAFLSMVGNSGDGYAFKNIKTIPISQIRRGMVGYGLTVLKGIKPERFRVRVVGILHNVFPNQDLILIVCDGPKMKKTGVASGMSGSPVYFNGKLAGALAYGPTWAKTPVAMVTPIKDMIDTANRPLRGPGKTILASKYRWGRGDADMIASLGLGYPKLHRLPRPGRLWKTAEVGAIKPLGLPVTVSGVDKSSLSILRKEMEPYGMFPVQGGGGSGVEAIKRYGRQSKFVPGGPIGVQYVRGDVSATGTGTVTAVSGDRVLAFGHPFWGFGEHYIPVVGAWIHMLMPSLNNSYKISTPLDEIGSLEQDRRPCIVASAKKKAPMIPLEVTIKTEAGTSRSFNVEVFSNRITTPRYLFVVTQMLLKNAVSDVTDVAIKAKVKMKLDGMSDMVFTDYFTAETGAAHGFSPVMTRGFKVLNFLLRNAFQRVGLKKVEVELDLGFNLKKAIIHNVKMDRSEVRPGSTVNLTVRLKKWLGGFYERTIPVKIPYVPDNSLIRIHVQSGDNVTPDYAPPEKLEDVIKYVKKTLSARQLVVSIRTAGEGTTAHGKLLTDLPGSVLDSIRTSSNSVTRKRFTRVWRKSVWDSHVLSGDSKLVLRVKDE